MDRVGNHGSMQPALHPLPVLLGRLRGSRGVQRLGGQRADRPACRLRFAGSRAIGGRAVASERLVRAGPSRNGQGLADVPGHQRDARRRRGVRGDSSVRHSDGFPVPRRLQAGNPRRLQAASRSSSTPPSRRGTRKTSRTSIVWPRNWAQRPGTSS
jgi:hypothetical protein